MKASDSIVLRGRLRIYSHIDGKLYLPHCRDIRNLVVTTGFHVAAEGLGAGYYGFISSGKLVQYCALGNDDTAPATTDTILVDERFREAITDAIREFNTVYFDTFIGTDDANTFIIKEAGLFGINADGSADSGTLLCRTTSFSPIDKSAQETLTFSWGISFEAA